MGGVVAWRRTHKETRVAAYTVCPFRGEPTVVIMPGVLPRDTLAVRVHEEAHAQQCRTMGPVGYRMRNIVPGGKLQLEAPAYCAAARARLRTEPDSEFVSDQLHEHTIAALSDITDSNAVKAALLATCPEIASKPRRTRFRPRSQP